MNSLNFWHSKRVLVTGHTGFKGGWLCLWLKQLSAVVSGYALPPESGRSMYSAAEISGALEKTIFGDIRDYDKLKGHILETQPEIVFHLAAQPIVRKSYQDPLETFSTNVMGTANLLQACRGVESIKAIVVVTTDKCYRNQEWDWGYRETDHLGGSDPYSSSKACAELVTSAFSKSFFERNNENQNTIAIASARAGNVIGGGDWSSDRLIPDFFRAIENQNAIQLRNPEATRPWQHVLEPLRAYLMLAERLFVDKPKSSEAYNFGPRDEDVVSVKKIIEKINSKVPQPLRYQIEQGQNPLETTLLKLDISKAGSQLNWRPLLNLDQSLDLTVDWYLGSASGKHPRDITEAQITNYQKLIESRIGE